MLDTDIRIRGTDKRDTFYNKKRNFPNAEERLYDGIQPIAVLLTKPRQKHKGFLCRAKFLPDNSRCILNVTKSYLKNYHVELFSGYIITDSKKSYAIADFHLNEFPKYIIADLKPADYNRNELFEKAMDDYNMHTMAGC